LNLAADIADDPAQPAAQDASSSRRSSNLRLLATTSQV
jgi:hypothetical protein